MLQVYFFLFSKVGKSFRVNFSHAVDFLRCHINVTAVLKADTHIVLYFDSTTMQ